jgi:hypothetical protein
MRGAQMRMFAAERESRDCVTASNLRRTLTVVTDKFRLSVGFIFLEVTGRRCLMGKAVSNMTMPLADHAKIANEPRAEHLREIVLVGG